MVTKECLPAMNLGSAWPLNNIIKIKPHLKKCVVLYAFVILKKCCEDFATNIFEINLKLIRSQYLIT